MGFEKVEKLTSASLNSYDLCDFSFELGFFWVKRWIILPLCESNSHLNEIV